MVVQNEIAVPVHISIKLENNLQTFKLHHIMFFFKDAVDLLVLYEVSIRQAQFLSDIISPVNKILPIFEDWIDDDNFIVIVYEEMISFTIDLCFLDVDMRIFDSFKFVQQSNFIIYWVRRIEANQLKLKMEK